MWLVLNELYSEEGHLIIAHVDLTVKQMVVWTTDGGGVRVNSEHTGHSSYHEMFEVDCICSTEQWGFFFLIKTALSCT